MVSALRDRVSGKSRVKKTDTNDYKFVNSAVAFLGTDDVDKVNKLINNLDEYGRQRNTILQTHQIISTFVAVVFISTLEPRRSVEINNFVHDNGEAKNFASKEEEYLDYISDITQTEIAMGETKEKLIEITE